MIYLPKPQKKDRKVCSKKLFFIFLLIVFSKHAFTQPSITSFSPTSGTIGTTVTITGNNFSSIPGNNIVYFGAVRTIVSVATTTSLIVTVPTGATYQPISVTTNNLTGYSDKPFIVTFAGGDVTPASFTYSAHADSLIGTETHGLAVGDLDGDGKSDLVVVDKLGNTLSIYKNTSFSGNVAFNNKIDYPTGNAPYSVAGSDLNGDGKLDIVVANQKDNTVSIFKNNSINGTISFDAKLDFAAGTQPSDISISDIDGDGKPDLAVSDIDLAGSVSILLNTSSATTISFAAKKEILVGVGTLNSVFTSDLDGNGKPDLIVTGLLVYVLQNTSTLGNVSFASPKNFDSPANPDAAKAADIDGDGKPDLITANFYYNTVSFLRNTSANGIISFSNRKDYPSGGSPVDIDVNDLNGDGKPDVSVLNTLKSISVLSNLSSSGNISFSANVDFPTLASDKVKNADLDGDGMPDIIESGSLYRVLIWRNTINAPYIASFSPTSGWSGTTTTITGANFTGTTAVNFGGIPAKSFIVNSSTNITAVLDTGASGNVSVNTSKGTAVLAGFIFYGPPAITSFTPTSGGTGTTITINGNNFTGTTSVSFGGIAATSFSVQSNNTLKAIVGSGATGSISVTTPGGRDTLPGFTYIPPPLITSFAPKTGTEGTEVSILGSNFINVKNLSFGGAQAASFTVNSSSNISAIVPITAVSGDISVITSQGTASVSGFVFTSPKPAPTITSFNPVSGSIGTTVTIKGTNFSPISTNNIVYFGAVRANISNSTDTALIVKVPAGTTYEPLSVTSNNLTVHSNKPFLVTFPSNNSGFDNNSFAKSIDFFSLQIPLQSATADIDGDGKCDVIILDEYTNEIKIFRNNSISGNISFEASKNFIIPHTNTYRFAVGDLDGDGKLDIAVVSSYYYGNTNILAIIRNTSIAGSISFTPPLTYHIDNYPNYIVIEDLNEDGKSDIVISHTSNTSIGIFKNISVRGAISLAPKVDFDAGIGPNCVAASDIDGDGKKDLVVNNTGGTFSVLKNISQNGIFSFDSQKQFLTNVDVYGMPLYLFTGDLNGDNKADVIVPNWNETYTYSIFPNESASGNISFASRIDLPAVEQAKIGTIGDLDGDGKPDIAIMGGYVPPIVSLCKNRSTTGNITLDQKVDFVSNVNQIPGWISLCDIDGDGKLDIVVLSYVSQGSFSVLRNTIETTLPLDLLKFSGKLADHYVQLQWQTSHEQNTAEFVLERAVDGATFSTIGTVAAAGNGNDKASYMFTDFTPQEGINYYRLKTIDRDGKSTYSNIIKVTLSFSSLKIYPNPAKGYTLIEHSPANISGLLKVIDITGNVIKEIPVLKNETKTVVTLNGIAHGVYKILWFNGLNKETGSIIIN